MTTKNVVILCVVAFDVFLVWEHYISNQYAYTPTMVNLGFMAMAIVNFFFGILWCGFWMGEKEQMAKDKLRDKVITALQSKRKDKINEAIDILNHPNGYPTNI